MRNFDYNFPGGQYAKANTLRYINLANFVEG